MLTLQDVQNKNSAALDFVEENVFFDSSITLADDDYIKLSVGRRVLQQVLVDEKYVVLDETPQNLITDMLRASLDQKSINMILATSLKSVAGVVTLDTAQTVSEETDPEYAKKLIEKQTATVGSIENLISIVRDNKGSLRIYRSYNEDKSEFYELIVERPLEFALSLIDFNKCNNSAVIDELLANSMAVDSGTSLRMFIPKEILCDSVLSFIEKDLPEFEAACLPYAQMSAKNQHSFQHVEDPFKTLFESF